MICLGCENPDDPVESREETATYHGGCCPHEKVESDWAGHGFCIQCLNPVMAVFDGERGSWEIV